MKKPSKIKKKSKAKYSAARAASNKKLTAHDGGDVSRANIVKKIERMKRDSRYSSFSFAPQKLINANALASWIKKMPARYHAKKGGL